VKPAPFHLHTPTTIADVVEMLASLRTASGGAEDDVEVKLLAGGQSLVPLLNLRLARPDHLVDLGGVRELRTVRVDDDGAVTIGAMATHDQLGIDPRLADHAPLLVAAVAHIGHGHIRNRGTLGGSIAHADPAAELPAVMLALDATFTVLGPSGRRSVPAADFFLGWFTTVLAVDELLVDVTIPPRSPASGGSSHWGFTELARRRGDFATVLVATIVEHAEDGTVTDARIVAGGVGATPVRCTAAEQCLIGTAAVDSDAGRADAAAAARREVDPVDDVHASATYRAEMVEVLVGRALGDLQPVASGPGADAQAGASAVPSIAEEEQPRDGALDRTDVLVNGQRHPLDGVADRRLLADWLRDDLRLTGTHLGCEHGVCGACTVLLDGTPVRSCLLFARQLAGRTVTTIEALGTPEDLHPVQEAFRDKHGLQCGFCTPGMVLATVDLLHRIPDPTEAEIRHALSGNICRCTGYVKIVEAVKAAADRGSNDRSSS
jgi:xanthine dehydrogenase iron-sulfur cluster and FAD-binding subunit A